MNHNEVHIWRAVLDQPLESIRDFERLLAEDERGRADRYHFQRDRTHFIVARAVLRLILSRYLGIAPAHLCFRYSAFGKPALAGEAAGTELRFNLSHSGGMALYGVTRRREIGVDLEYIREDVEVEEIACRFFARSEVERLLELPPATQRRAFFNCWTRKEAYIKARGEGLSLPLTKFSVSLSPGAAALLVVQDEPEESTRWRLQDLSFNSHYAAAAAVEGNNWRLTCWHLAALEGCDQ